MCILMYAHSNASIPRKHLENACDNNPDGFGWAIITFDGKEWGLLTDKGMKDRPIIDSFLEAREQHPSWPALFHARIATHGTTTVDNAHPFWVAENMTVLAHNGMLPIREQDGKSDTRLFAEEWLPTLGVKELLDTDEGFEQLEDFASGSKLVVLSIDPELERFSYIVNEELGHWDQGVWYSNNSYKYKSYSYSYSGWDWRRQSSHFQSGTYSVAQDGHIVFDSDKEDRPGRNYLWAVCELCRDEFLANEDEPLCPTCGWCTVHDTHSCNCHLNGIGLEERIEAFVAGATDDLRDAFDDAVDLLMDGEWYIDNPGALLWVYDERREAWREASYAEYDAFEELYGDIDFIAADDRLCDMNNFGRITAHTMRQREQLTANTTSKD